MNGSILAWAAVHHIHNLMLPTAGWGIGVATHSLTPGERIAVQRVFGGLVLLWGAVLVMHGIGRLR